MSLKISLDPLVLNECLEALGLVLEYNIQDHPMHQHAIRVGEGCTLLGAKAGFDGTVLQRLYYAGLLHDVGKISVPLDILQKKKALTEEEFGVVRNHTVFGSQIIASLPQLSRLAFWVRWHHERWDGQGYPDGLEKNEIPLEIQILAAVDCFDSLQTPRMDRPASTPDQAFEMLRDFSGTHFSPDVVDLVFEMHRERTLVPGKSSQQFLDLKEKHIKVPLAGNTEGSRDNFEITGLYPVLKLFARVIDTKHHYTSGHSTRVAILSRYLAEQMGFSSDELIRIEIAGLMHDAGKISIPNDVLDKKMPPSPEEWEIIKKHPVHSYEILKKITLFEDIADIARFHHVWADGRGYPEAGSGEIIPLFSRIIAVADAYDAMTTARAYSAAKTPETAYRIIREGIGSQFDPRAAGALLGTSPKYVGALFSMHGV